MKKLIPETLGKSIFRRYTRIAKPALLERGEMHPGYASTAKPLVWRSVQALPESGGLPFLRRRPRFPFTGEAFQGEDQAAVEPHEADAGGETVLPPTPRSASGADRPEKIQRKIGPPARRTAVELPKSPPVQPVTEVGKAGATLVQTQAEKPAKAPLPTPAKGRASRKLEEKTGTSRVDASADKQEPAFEEKPIRPVKPEKKRESPRDARRREPEPGKVGKTASHEKLTVSQEVKPGAPARISRRREEKPVVTQISRKAARKEAAKKRSVKPAPPGKLSGEAEVQTRPAAHKPASDNKKIRDISAQRPIQPGLAATRIVRRKPAEEAHASQTAEAKPVEKRSATREHKPTPRLLPAQPEITPEPPLSEKQESPVRPMAKPALLKTPRSLINPTRPVPGRTPAKPAGPKPGGQNLPRAKMHSMPENPLPPEAPPRAAQRSQAMPAQPHKSAQSKPSLPSEDVEQEAKLVVKPVIGGNSSQKEGPIGQPPASSASRGEHKADATAIFHPRASAPVTRIARKAELPPFQARSKPAPAAVQREISPAETPASPPPEQAPPDMALFPSSSPAQVSTFTGVPEGKTEENARALDEMARQVYEILQRRLQVEFERSHGLKI